MNSRVRSFFRSGSTLLAVVTAVGLSGLQLPVGVTSVSVTTAGAPAAFTISFVPTNLSWLLSIQR